MKNSFKYSLLLLLLSFLIATLCCNSHLLFENYTEYPFTNNYEEENYSIENLQEALFKYNNIVTSSQKTGAIEYDIPKIVNEIKDERIERERIQYSKLMDTQPTFGNYMPFESRILSDQFKMEKEPEKIKGEKIIIDPTQTPETLPAQSLDPQVEGGLGTTENIQDRDSSGNIYYPPHACIGQWSDWNRDNCGSERERCGIMFKRYEILEREKNDKNLPGKVGKPCDYDDGIIKYKYCYGDDADDYESNTERCGINTNGCPCKLNNESSIKLETGETEKVYDLEDEECLFEIERNCICPKGFTSLNTSNICKLTPGVDCSIEEPGCIYTAGTSTIEEKCEIPRFISKQSEEDFYDNYTSIDGKCQKKECPCLNGTEVESEKCIISGLELCNEKIPCDEGYYMSGSPPTCKKQTEGEEGTDVYKECSCLYGSPRIEDATSMRCNPSNTDFSNLNKIRQFCNNTSCEEGYEIVTGDASTKTAICNEYYPETLYDNINCCVPKYDTCLLEETELEGKNITRKNKSNKYSRLISKTINELKKEHNEIDGVVDIEAEDLFNQEDPKQYLINKIINLSDDEEVEEACNNNINIKECYGEFKCKPGYAFLPSNDYTSENELRITGCETKGSEGIQNICYPQISCMGQNVEDVTFDGTTNQFSAIIGGVEQACMFPSMVTNEEIREFAVKNGIIQLPEELNSTKCGIPRDNTTCNADTDDNCFLKQIQTHYPTWNGTCVPVSCSISDEIKEVYNISYDNCSSEKRNCGLSNISCKNNEYEVPNSRKMIYCPSPQVVDSEYLTNEYELVNIGCSSNPPEPSDAEAIRRQRMASAGEIISEDAEEQASQRQAPDEDNIGERADFTGSTSDQQLELEVGLEEQRIAAEEDLEERSNSLASMGTR